MQFVVIGWFQLLKKTTFNICHDDQNVATPKKLYVLLALALLTINFLGISLTTICKHFIIFYMAFYVKEN